MSETMRQQLIDVLFDKAVSEHIRWEERDNAVSWLYRMGCLIMPDESVECCQVGRGAIINIENYYDNHNPQRISEELESQRYEPVRTTDQGDITKNHGPTWNRWPYNAPEKNC